MMMLTSWRLPAPIAASLDARAQDAAFGDLARRCGVPDRCATSASPCTRPAPPVSANGHQVLSNEI